MKHKKVIEYSIMEITSLSKSCLYNLGSIKKLLFIALFALPQYVWADGINVLSFKLLENDRTANARGTERRDMNGDKAALIKIVTSERGFTFNGGSIGIVATEERTNEIWLYVPKNAQKLTITHPKIGILRNYYYPISIIGGRTYEMLLDFNKIITISGVIVDENDKPIVGSTIILESDFAKMTTVSDVSGLFKNSLVPQKSSITLKATCVGYKAASFTCDVVDLNNSSGLVKVKLLEDNQKNKNNKSIITALDFDPLKSVYESFFRYGSSEHSFHKDPKKLYNEATNYYFGKNGYTKDLKKAFDLYLQAAELGYDEAQLRVGYMYHYSEGTSQDQTKAFLWFQKAAFQGNMTALFILGLCYKEGEGVKEDLKIAFCLFKKAAEHGKTEAQNQVGSCYVDGLGVTRDYQIALSWFRKAAEQGDINAMINIGVMYQNGLGVKTDLSQALAWYNKAAEKGHENAKKYAANLAAKGVKPATVLMSTLPTGNSSVSTTSKTNTAPTVVKSYSTTPRQQKRIALIIGNGDYANGPLMNPVNDAKDMKAKLQKLGFEVMGATNVESKGKMREQVRNFCAKAKDYDAALFFYSGHARQDNNVNYLIPTRSDIKSEADIEDQCIAMNWVVKEMQDTGAKNVIVLLDACRNAPPIASLSRNMDNLGLASMSVNKGTLIGFATQSGEVALDGHGQRNSPYTAALLKTLDEPGLSYLEFFSKVKKLVLQATNNKQMPIIDDKLYDDFIFNTK